MTEHQWLCLDHIRQFNASWNFFQGMSMAEIEEFQGAASTWHRPTWTLGANPDRARARGPAGPSMGRKFDPRFVDPVGILDDGPVRPETRGRKAERDQKPRRPEPSTMIRTSLAALDLDHGEMVSLKEIKARYKQLVKRYHPDTNGGDNGTEDRLKRVIQAYRHLVTCGYFR